MEMRKTYHRLAVRLLPVLTACLLLVLTPHNALPQEKPIPQASYTIRGGRMLITIDKHIGKMKLAKFVEQYDLSDLGLPNILLSGKTSKLKTAGWKIDLNTRGRLVLSKPILGVDQLENPEKRMALTEEDHPNTYDLFPAENDNLVYGFNRFAGKHPFAVHDSLVTFFLKWPTIGRQVLLAGSFTNWQSHALHMTPTDSGWIATVKLSPGKYWYKFIINGDWITDPDNKLIETDPSGNMNSVYYKPNTVFSLSGSNNAPAGTRTPALNNALNSARAVFLTGSFNDWNPKELPMEKGPLGWTIHLYLSEGTYTYKFVVDGKWYADPANALRSPDGHQGFNSIYRLGKPHLFSLKGYTTAKAVALSGSFNGWKTYDLPMHKTADGWELPYTLGPGNYQYLFLVDGKWMKDPANPLFLDNRDSRTVNSFLIVQPNYTFRLEGYPDAKSVFLSGDFNDWTPDALRMQRVGNAWVFKVHLAIGKHVYKFIVDGDWIRDPDNPLWEQNEFDTGNSIIWMEDR